MSDDPVEQFFKERRADIKAMGQDEELWRKSFEWMKYADKYKYSYNFTWLGRPIIKLPADIIIQQELMWSLEPDVIIETGIAHGGSIVFSASMMELIGNGGEVVAIDIEIRPHNRKLIEAHPLFDRITIIEGDSTDPENVEQIRRKTDGKQCVMVILDSLHSHNHVYNELHAYAPMVTVGSYCILPDTFIEFFPKGYFSKERPWDVGNNPYTAMQQYLKDVDNFEIDKQLTNKAMITETIDGYLKRVR